MPRLPARAPNENDPAQEPHRQEQTSCAARFESPALDVIGLLRRKGAQVDYHDPYIPHIHHEADGWIMDSLRTEDLMTSVAAADAVVIITDHKSYDYKAIVECAKFVFDSRNATRKFVKDSEKVVRL